MSRTSVPNLGCIGLGVDLGGRAALSEMDLMFKAGEVTVVVGPNGAGKSTLLSCLAGLRPPSYGTVVFGTHSLHAMERRERARRLAYLPQSPEIAWAVDARTLVGLGRVPYLGARGTTAEDDAAVERALTEAGVEQLGSRLVDTLSGGERARVLIARALAGEPQWLLADEPLTGLDPGHQLDATALFRKQADSGTGVILTLHDLTMALRIADRIVVLAEGRVLSDGSVSATLTPEVLKRAYGVEAILAQGPGGPTIDVIRRS